MTENKKRYRRGKPLMCPKCRNYYSAAFNACACGFINKGRKSKYPEMAKLYQDILRKFKSYHEEKMFASLAQQQANETVSPPQKSHETKKGNPTLDLLLEMITALEEDAPLILAHMMSYAPAKEWIDRKKASKDKK